MTVSKRKLSQHGRLRIQRDIRHAVVRANIAHKHGRNAAIGIVGDGEIVLTNDDGGWVNPQIEMARGLNGAAGDRNGANSRVRLVSLRIRDEGMKRGGNLARGAELSRAVFLRTMIGFVGSQVDGGGEKMRGERQLNSVAFFQKGATLDRINDVKVLQFEFGDVSGDDGISEAAGRVSAREVTLIAANGRVLSDLVESETLGGVEGRESFLSGEEVGERELVNEMEMKGRGGGEKHRT